MEKDTNKKNNTVPVLCDQYPGKAADYYCTHCSAPTHEFLAKYCWNCGKKLDWDWRNIVRVKY